MSKLPLWAAALPWDLIRRVAARHALDPLLVAAMIQVESGGQEAATRYEPGYRWLSEPERWARELGISKDTEVIAQAHSYGLLQIMGGTARGLGYTGYCAALIGEELGLEWGCRYLARCFDRFHSSELAIAAYNAGSPRDVAPKDGRIDNQAYVDKVLARLADLVPKIVD